MFNQTFKTNQYQKRYRCYVDNLGFLGINHIDISIDINMLLNFIRKMLMSYQYF